MATELDNLVIDYANPKSGRRVSIQPDEHDKIQLFTFASANYRMRFKLQHLTPARWGILHIQSGKRVAPPGNKPPSSPDNGNTRLVLSTSTGNEVEWEVEVEGGGKLDYGAIVRFRSAYWPNHYLNLAGAQEADGTGILAWPKANTANELWKLTHESTR
jgi:hypothetical protein